MDTLNRSLLNLCNTVSELRSRNGCPWDRKQTTLSLRKYLKEESEELIEAITEDNPEHLCEEIGDVLFHLVMLSEICSESGYFSLEDAINGINNKMIRRHPHVFADSPTGTEEELKIQWEKIKTLEKKKK
ncbi:MAG TPA: nucleotide pyrophosphohydrolase [Desulfocapsa sulfexigens]|nr:nucleotide pyrophosphohydrolase [Desulfocapsa sulfexigens]